MMIVIAVDARRRSSSVRPARPRIGRRVSTIAAHSAPTAGAAAQQPEPGRPDVEDVLREHGQQRDGAAEQDGEQVERDRAETAPACGGSACTPPSTLARSGDVPPAPSRPARSSSVPTNATSESDAAAA